MPQAKTQTQTCPACQGHGLIAVGGQAQTCPYCGGSGQVQANQGFPVPFWYVFDIVWPANNSAPVSITKQISNEADFQWLMLIGTSDFSVSGVQVLIQDLSAPFQFSSDPVNIGNVIGTAQLPFTLVEPYVFGKNSNLRITLSLPSGVGAPGAQQNTEITLFGYLLVKQSGIGASPNLPQQSSS
ncbi:MAG: hypothetical protein ACRD3D_13175 [Terriglobia bacterium]